ncbi:zinc finger protein 583 [Cephus cinctus]|uniref:Zinc finger protein 583 n=1 Tax=Cephus cinctus TaxID=211228 RepID=A0AAJ7BJI8_CEPCN|nr:zinc finger protein 583 [Cephus cinctus]
MTNTQQTILGQVSGSEQPREEVQLTELTPVKQSRIKENSNDKDDHTTDGLKALRSLSQDGVDEFVEGKNFEFSSKIDAIEEIDTDYADRPIATGTRKRRTQGRRCCRAKEDPLQESIGARDKSSKISNEAQTDARNSARVNKKLNHLRNAENKKSAKSDVNNATAEDSVREKRYVLRTKFQSLRNSKQKKQAGSIKNVNRKSNNKSASSNSVDEVFEDGLDPAGQDEDETVESETQSQSEEEKSLTEENLRRKIDAIIQANYLLEQENNNVMQHDHNKLDDETQNCSSNEYTGEKRSDQEEDGTLKKYCCVICNARFKGSGGLRNHYKVVHAAGPIFTCNECGKEFPLKERLKLHVRTHTGFKPYKCPECDKTFARGGQLVQHRRTHSQVKPYRCVLCSGTFTCAANLALHVKRHNGQKDHKCEICGRGFVRRDALKKHLECLHRDVKSFLCVICNKTFKGHLPQHMRTHAQDRPHGCATCGQRFAQKSQLTVHQRTHSGQRPFRCLVCWQAFAHSTALKLHTRRHTGERPFKCAECNAGFTQLPHWKKHMKCIHGRSEPYSCKNCNSFFRIKNDLETHEKTCLADVTLGSESNDATDKVSSLPRYRVMTVEKMRLLLAVLLKRISKPERLDELGFGKRLIDEVLEDSLVSAGKDPVRADGLSEVDALRKNLATFLEWTVPKEHWENFQKMNKTPEEILETLTAT